MPAAASASEGSTPNSWSSNPLAEPIPMSSMTLFGI
jgi:hypothetical protein